MELRGEGAAVAPACGGSEMNDQALIGHRFNGCHQLAIILTQHLTAAAALAACRENGWSGVKRALEEQTRMVTAIDPSGQRSPATRTRH